MGSFLHGLAVLFFYVQQSLKFNAHSGSELGIKRPPQPVFFHFQPSKGDFCLAIFAIGARKSHAHGHAISRSETEETASSSHTFPRGDYTL
jgi:hypothetical protein